MAANKKCCRNIDRCVTLGQIPKKSNLCRNVFGIFKTKNELTGFHDLYQTYCLRKKYGTFPRNLQHLFAKRTASLTFSGNSLQIYLLFRKEIDTISFFIYSGQLKVIAHPILCLAKARPEYFRTNQTEIYPHNFCEHRNNTVATPTITLLRYPQQRYCDTHNDLRSWGRTHVTFSWCDRENGYQKKTRTIPGVKFLERFLDHIVPPYFRRIRHLGFLSSRNKKQSLASIRESLGEKLAPAAPLSRAQVLALCFGERSLLRCRDCGGELQLMETCPKDRAPPFNVMAGTC